MLDNIKNIEPWEYYKFYIHSWPITAGSKEEESLVLKLRFQEIVFGGIARNSCVLKIASVENIDCLDFFHSVQKIIAAVTATAS